MLNTTVSSSNGTDGQVPVDMQAYENDLPFRSARLSSTRTSHFADQLQRINDWVDAQPPRQPENGWATSMYILIRARRHNYQNIIEGGEVFEEMMDNPPWYDAARRYIVNDFNGLAIQENFLNVREQGGYIGIHSGGHIPALFSRSPSNGAWNVGQITF
jgi:hypothetical protein